MDLTTSIIGQVLPGEMIPLNRNLPDTIIEKDAVFLRTGRQKDIEGAVLKAPSLQLDQVCTELGVGAIESMATNGDILVAVGAVGRIIYSYDGNLWYECAKYKANDRFIVSVVYNQYDGYFYACGTRNFLGSGIAPKSGLLIRSKDGRTWSTVKNTPVEYISGVALNEAGVCVLVGTKGLWWSEDMTTWNFVASNQYLARIFYLNGRFVAVGKATLIMTSVDGKSWSTATTPGTVDHDLRSVAYDGTMFWAVDDTGHVYVSQDNATSWTLAPSPSMTNTKMVSVQDGKVYVVGIGVSWANGGTISPVWSTPAHFGASSGYAVNGQFSVDTQILWRQVFKGHVYYGGLADPWTFLCRLDTLPVVTNNTSNIPANYKHFEGLAYGKGVYVACGYGYGSGSATYPPLWSVDGVTWTIGTIVGGSNAVGTFQFAYYSERLGLFIAANGASQILWSSDGKTWTVSISPIGGNLEYIAESPQALVIVSSGSMVISSTDGKTWTKRTFPVATANLSCVTYSNTLQSFLAIDTSASATLGVVYKGTPDGVTWTAYAPSGIPSTEKFIFVDCKVNTIISSQKNNYICVDGVNWVDMNVTFNAVSIIKQSHDLFNYWRIGIPETTDDVYKFYKSSNGLHWGYVGVQLGLHMSFSTPVERDGKIVISGGPASPIDSPAMITITGEVPVPLLTGTPTLTNGQDTGGFQYSYDTIKYGRDGKLVATGNAPNTIRFEYNPNADTPPRIQHFIGSGSQDVDSDGKWMYCVGSKAMKENNLRDYTNMYTNTSGSLYGCAYNPVFDTWIFSTSSGFVFRKADSYTLCTVRATEGALFEEVGVNPKGQMVMVGRYKNVRQGVILVSDDAGLNWNLAYSVTTQGAGFNGFRGIKWCHDRWIATGDGIIATSLNGYNWKIFGISAPLDRDAASFARDAAYANGVYVVACSNSVIYYSTDGENWLRYDGLQNSLTNAACLIWAGIESDGDDTIYLAGHYYYTSKSYATGIRNRMSVMYTLRIGDLKAGVPEPMYDSESGNPIYVRVK